MPTREPLALSAVTEAARRIDGVIRPVTLIPAEGEIWAAEFLQHTGSFKTRGAVNFVAAHMEDATMPPVGVTIASGGNAGLACAWAARRIGVPVRVFLPVTAPTVKVDRLRGYGAAVVSVGARYSEALDACREYAAESGALMSHAYDDAHVAAGAGTLLLEIVSGLAGAVDTVVVAVGGGGLFAGLATVAAEHEIRVVASEPAGCQALHAALAAGAPVDVPVTSIAADSLGATRVTDYALQAAERADVTSVVVEDADIVAARRDLWASHRIVIEHGAATALAALRARAYVPSAGERVVVILCGANTDPGDLASAEVGPAGR